MFSISQSGVICTKIEEMSLGVLTVSVGGVGPKGSIREVRGRRLLEASCSPPQGCCRLWVAHHCSDMMAVSEQMGHGNDMPCLNS